MPDALKQILPDLFARPLFAILVILSGWLAGHFLGKAIAMSVRSPRLSGFVKRLCNLIGVCAALPLAAKVVQLF